MSARRIRVLQLVILAGLLLLWEFLPSAGLVDAAFVPPLHAVVGVVLDLARSGDLLRHVRLSVVRAVGGFAIAVAVGTPLGFLLGGAFPRLGAAAEPLLELCAQANPVVLFHVVLLFLGIGEAPKLFIIAWLCTWSITFSAMAGTRHVDEQLLAVGRSFGIGRWALFHRVILPSATPTLFTGIRLAGGYAFVMLTAAEMMGASSGLGWFIVQSQESYYPPRIFAGAALVTLLALLMDAMLKRLEARVIHWRPPPDEHRALLGEQSSWLTP